jgi:hypothetical protein
MAKLVVSAVSRWDGKGLTKGSYQIKAFDATVNKLGKTFASVFAAQKLLAFSKASVKAFASDEKASRSLALQLKNTGNAFQTSNVENYIGMLQRTTAVLDDNLRPAFQTLLTTTGDVVKSEKALSLALDISAGTGKDLQTVSLALAKGYAGQTTGLSRLGAGLTKATLKTGDMELITSILTKKFQGQALEAVKGYAGQIALLGVATQNTKELIGKGLLDALKTAAGDQGVTNIADQMERAAAAVADMIRGLGVIAAKLQVPEFLGGLGKVIDVLSGGTFSRLQSIGAKDRYAKAGPKTSTTLAQFNAQVKTSTNIIGADNKAKLDALKLAGDQKALDELKKKMDVERTDLAYALTQATDDETRARIAAKIAILDGDAKAAASLNNLVSGQVLAANQILLLASAAASAAAMLNYLKSGSGSGGAVYGTGSTPGNTSIPATPAIVPPTNVGTGMSGNAEITLGTGAYATQGPAGFTQPVVVNVNAGVIGNEQQVTDAIQNSLQQMLRYGWSTNYAGGL